MAKSEHYEVFVKEIDKYFKKRSKARFRKGLENMAKRKRIEFEYRGFWIESEAFDQAENGHPEDGITFTSYVWHSQEEREALKDQIDDLLESYGSPEELEEKVKKAIDKYIKKNKLDR